MDNDNVCFSVFFFIVGCIITCICVQKKTKSMTKITIRLMIPILQTQILWPAMSTNFTQNWREHFIHFIYLFIFL